MVKEKSLISKAIKSGNFTAGGIGIKISFLEIEIPNY
jgi:hypothetical protein